MTIRAKAAPCLPVYSGPALRYGSEHAKGASRAIRRVAYQQLANSYYAGASKVMMMSVPQYVINYNNNGCVINHVYGVVSPQKSVANQPSAQAPSRNISINPLRVDSHADVGRLTYKPYTLKDYENVKPQQRYYQLGGLGANIGTPDWVARKRRADRLHQFGHSVQLINRIYFEKLRRKMAALQGSEPCAAAVKMRRRQMVEVEYSRGPQPRSASLGADKGTS